MENELPSLLSGAIGKERLAEAAAEVIDIGIEAASKSGLVNAIPIFSALNSLYGAAKDVRHGIFVRKTARFLSELGKLETGERQAFADRLFASGKADEFAETVLLLLERADEAEKPAMIARVVAGYVRGEMDDEWCFRLCASINRSFVADLKLLKSFKPGVQKQRASADALFSAGLLANAGFDGGGADRSTHPGGTIYELNSYGMLLATYV